MRSWRLLLTVAALLASSCSGGGDSADQAAAPTATSVPTEEVAAGSTPEDEPAATAVPDPSPTAQPDPTATVEPTLGPEPTSAAPLTVTDAGNFAINWDGVASPFYIPNAGPADDPYFHIHSDEAQDGFYLSLELYTTGYGGLWTGELGDVAISCSEPIPAPNSTGICFHLVPEPGAADVNADFAATGSITIVQLDADGYEIVVNEVTFSDGTEIEPFTLRG